VKADRTTVDYKTVGSTPNVDQEAWQHEIQLTAYALLIEDATSEPSPGSELVFLVKTKSPKVIVHRSPPPTQLQRDRFARLVEVYANGVSNEQYHPSPGMQCSWCGSSGFLVATVAGSGTGWGDENRRARPKSTGSGGWSL
jgi:putative RecB family exonuclease